MRRQFTGVAVLLAVVGFSWVGQLQRAQADGAAPVAPPRFAGLGSHTRLVTTKSAESQAYFNQGLAFRLLAGRISTTQSSRRRERNPHGRPSPKPVPHQSRPPN
jgi:hypothetical protein